MRNSPRYLRHKAARHTRFVLVNGTPPCPQSVCVLCCEPIGVSYLR